jgi:hypothetical protein
MTQRALNSVRCNPTEACTEYVPQMVNRKVSHVRVLERRFPRLPDRSDRLVGYDRTWKKKWALARLLLLPTEKNIMCKPVQGTGRMSLLSWWLLQRTAPCDRSRSDPIGGRNLRCRYGHLFAPVARWPLSGTAGHFPERAAHPPRQAFASLDAPDAHRIALRHGRGSRRCTFASLQNLRCSEDKPAYD